MDSGQGRRDQRAAGTLLLASSDRRRRAQRSDDMWDAGRGEALSTKRALTYFALWEAGPW